MAKTLQEYAEWLDGRGLIWPQPPPVERPKATPFCKLLPGIRAVAWSIYGTLLRISDGELLHVHPKPLQMQVALEKTVEEFNMWNSMYRKPGAPWEYMLTQYRKQIENRQLAATSRAGDVPEVNSADVWRALLAQLEQKEYRYDAGLYGDWDELAEKVAYFFHAALQGVEAAPGALGSLGAVARGGVRQTLLGAAQPFTLVQLLRALRAQGTLPPVAGLLAVEQGALSFKEGVRPPSRSLYRACLARFAALGIEPHEVLYVGNRLRDDLSAAKACGLQTALYAGDALGLHVDKSDLKDPEHRPERLLTDLIQIREVLGVD